MDKLIKVMCFGTFDKFHPGHLSYLKKSKESGNYLIVVVARDKNVLKIKNKTSSQSEKLRLEKIKSLDFVNKAILGNLKDRFAVIKKYKPDIISLGYDQPVDLTALGKVFSGQIVKQKSFKPSVYKSSKIKNV